MPAAHLDGPRAARKIAGMSGRSLFLVLMVAAVAAVGVVLSRAVPQTADDPAARYRGMGTPPASAGSPGKPTVLRPGDSTGAAKDADALTPWVDRAAESAGVPKRTDEYVVGPAPESVFTVAQRMFGETTRWRDVLEANRGVIRDQDAIPAGTRLRIPPAKRRISPAAPRLAGGVD